MTNNHVLGSAAEAATSLAEFNYQDGIQTPTVFELDPGSLFVTDPTLDYTLVAVRSHGTGPSEVKSFGFNRLIEQQGRILIGEALNIIQHPNRELKQVALRENQLKDILPKFLHYHLSACESGCNSFRGDIPYFDFRISRRSFETSAGSGTRIGWSLPRRKAWSPGRPSTSSSATQETSAHLTIRSDLPH
jgi:hypothetical protein